jgi:hypothetical protein
MDCVNSLNDKFARDRAAVAARSHNLTTRDSLANAKSNAGMKLRRGKMTAE